MEGGGGVMETNTETVMALSVRWNRVTGRQRQL